MELSVLRPFFFMLFIFPFIHKFVEAVNVQYDECKKPFLCGDNKVNLSYPFYDEHTRPSYCGYPGFQIDCGETFPEIPMPFETYNLLSMSSISDTISVSMQTYYSDYCPQNLLNFTLYKYAFTTHNITLFFGCPTTTIRTQLPCKNASNNNNQVFYFTDQNFGSSQGEVLNEKCQSSIVVPALLQPGSQTVQNMANNNFGLEWIAENEKCDGCRGSGGKCGYDANKSRFTCHCPNGSYDSDCTGSTLHKVQRIAGVILACIITGLGMLALLVCYFKRRYSTENQDIDDFLKKYGPLATKSYTYRSLKKITNSFKDKLGEGGYSIVYKGKLLNGDLVAVKLLKVSKGNAEEFINEVTSIGRTNHVNIVTLLGFCFEGQKRALVYDFMPNGSLEKFIYGKTNHQSLGWDELFQIAVGIARGLEYLHRGCNTRIVHFDIKPHNILLDENFCPKISDFGLAKPFQKDESIISMSGARGTVGFIAPEVFLSGFGGVSHKSDVYSYGMLVLDMVGCRKDVNADAEQKSEQYFPQWIYKQLEQPEELDHQDILNGEEKGTMRKMILVSLWCIQTNPSSRPPMTRVVEMLEGPLEYLEIPPIPTLFSPPISHPISSSKATISI